MHDTDDELTPEQRLAAIGNILASGILRLHARKALLNQAKESGPQCLDVSPETVLSVTTRVNGSRVSNPRRVE